MFLSMVVETDYSKKEKKNKENTDQDTSTKKMITLRLSVVIIEKKRKCFNMVKLEKFRIKVATPNIKIPWDSTARDFHKSIFS